MRIILIVALLALGACGKKPEAPPPKPRQVEKPAPPLPNFRKGVIRMQKMEHTPASVASARRAMPNLIARAEARYLRNATSTETCAAWDRIAANAVKQNDPALVHMWGVLADRRCAGTGRETRYWSDI